jgi:uncharacterized membrane-anchored protein
MRERTPPVPGQPTQQDGRALAGAGPASVVRHAAVAGGAPGRAGRVARLGLSKVPEVTVAFWITKVLTTGMGEAASDYLTRAMDPAIAVGLGFAGFAAAIGLQFATRRYRTWVYWLAVAMVGVFGTMAADVLHVGLGVPYIASTAFYLCTLAVIFGVWYATERTLSIHSIRTPRREFFYWATVLATFALGTAAGDLTATTMHLGYLDSGVLFAVVIAVPAVAWRLGLNPILTFWAAYIVTRPLGASFADWVAVPPNRGGLNAGYGPVTVVMVAAIVALVGFLWMTERRRAS